MTQDTTATGEANPGANQEKAEAAAEAEEEMFQCWSCRKPFPVSKKSEVRADGPMRFTLAMCDPCASRYVKRRNQQLADMRMAHRGQPDRPKGRPRTFRRS